MPAKHVIDARFHPAPPDLEGCLTSIYRIDVTLAGDEPVEDWLQPEWGNFRVFSGTLPRSRIADGAEVADARLTVTGPSSRPNRFVLGSTRMWGVGLLPLGWARLVRRPADACANLVADGESHPDFARFRPLAAIFDGETGDDAREYARIVEVLRSLDAPVADEALIRRTHAAMIEAHLASVADFAGEVNLSVRALERLCRRHFGFTPKVLLRRQRFMRSLARFMTGEDPHWTAAIDELYTDQAHFNRDFHAFMGMAPSEYAAIPHPVLEAVMRERDRQLGSAVQTLDAPDRGPSGAQVDGVT